MDCGMKHESTMPAIPSQGDRPKIVYPAFDLRDDKAEEFLNQFPADVDDEFDAKVHLKVTGTRSDEYGQCVTFSVLKLEPSGQAAKSEPLEKETKDEEATEKEAKPKAKGNPAVEKMMAED